MLGGILRWPFVATKRLILALAPGQVGAPADVWPVAGLDAERASCILYALRQAAATEEVRSSLCRLQDEGAYGTCTVPLLQATSWLSARRCAA
jgi:hypothetical protein